VKLCRQIIAALLTLMLAVSVFAQDDEPLLEEFHQRGRAEARLDDAFRAMYNLEFAKADSVLEQFTGAYPSDPLGPAAQAVSVLFCIFEQHKILQAEFFSSDGGYAKRQIIVPDQAARKRFESALNRSETLAKQALGQNPSSDHSLLAMALVYGLRADYAALIEHRDFAALRFSDTGNDWAKKLLAVSPTSYDAYVATGIQKYLVSLKPAPMRWMLRLGGIQGDQDEGIRELKLAAEKGRYLAPFARILLAVTHLRRQEYQQAFALLAGLQLQFSHNPLFANERAKLQKQISAKGILQTVDQPGADGQ
jgi:hypothetical protein